jgi:hypothetical protein
MSDAVAEAIPVGLAAMEPGPLLGVMLSSIDVASVSEFDQIVVLRAHQRMASHYAAKVYRDMTVLVDSMSMVGEPRETAADVAAAEIRAALHLTRRATDVEVAFALDLRDRLPVVYELFVAGRIDRRRARTIERETVHLDDAGAAAVAERIASVAAELTTGQLAARIRRLCIEVDPGAAARRYDHAVDERRVIAEVNPSGTANLSGLDLPPDRVAAIRRRIDEIARGFAGDDRTMDQRRADVYLDLLAGRPVDGADTTRGSVEVRVDLDTLAALTEHPGELGGYGPVIADVARRAAEDQIGGEWRYTVTDPQTGIPVASGVTRRRPTTAQRRMVETRDPVCVFPGCRMPAARCDLDHIVPWSEGGDTTVEQLAPLCRHDHDTIRHRAGWDYRRLEDGRYQWTSRTGPP